MEKRRTLGDRHPDTLLSVNNLAVLLNDLGRQTGDLRMLREAEPLKREALQGCREVLGNRHPHARVVANLADLLMQLGPASRARSRRRSRSRGRSAAESSATTAGQVGRHAGRSRGAGPSDQAGVERPRRQVQGGAATLRGGGRRLLQGLGQYHPALSYAHEHSRLFDMGHVKEAEKAEREIVKGVRASLGDSHPETLMA